MIKYICFCMLVLASVFVVACQQNKLEKVQSAIETSNKPSIKKEIPTLKEKKEIPSLKEFYFDSYQVVDYFTIEQDSILALDSSALDLDLVVKQYCIKALVIDQNYLTIVRSDNQRDTYLVERVGEQLYISDNEQKNLLCIIKDSGDKIILYTSFFDLFGRHKLAKTKALFSEFSYGILPGENLLEEYSFLEHKTGNLIHFSYLFVSKK